MGMNFDYGTLGVNNAYATSFKGNPAGQAATTPILDEGVSDYELMQLSTMQQKQEEKKSNNMKTLGIAAAAVAVIATGYAYCKGKKINGGAGGFKNILNNVGTGFKNFFKKVGEAPKSIYDLSSAKVAAKEKVDDLTYQLGKHNEGSDAYKDIKKQLDAAEKKLKIADKNLVKATKDSLLQSDAKYNSMLKVKTQNVEQLKALQEEKTTLEKLVEELTKKQASSTLDADEAKKLTDATEKLKKIGSSAVKGKNGAESIAASGQIQQLEEAIKQQQTAIGEYAKNFDTVARARIQTATDAKLLENFKATLGDATTQQAWQAKKLSTLEQAAEASKKAGVTAETVWADAVEGFTVPDFFKEALKLD